MSAAVYLLVDLENVQPSPQEVESWLGKDGEAWVFYGPNQLKRKAAFEAESPRSTLVPISRPGANSLDFHLVFYLGYLAAKHPRSRFVVLAKDTDYDPPIAHAETLAFSVERLSSLLAPASPAMKPLSGPKKTAKAQPVGKKTAAPPKKKLGTATTAVTVPKIKVKGSPEAETAPKAAVKKATAQKLLIAVYRDVVKALEGPNRPNTPPALRRFIQTKYGPTPEPEKVEAVVQRLITADAIHLKAGKLGYGARVR